MATARRRQMPYWLASILTYGFVNVVTRGASGVLTLLYAYRLTPGELGSYAILITIAALIDVVTNLGVTQAILRQYFDFKHDGDAGKAFLARVIRLTRLIGLTLVVVAGLICLSMWDHLVSNHLPSWPYLPLMLVYAYVMRSSKIFDIVARTLDKPGMFATYRLVQMAALILLSFLFVFQLRWGLQGALLATVGSAVFGAAIRSYLFRNQLPASGRSDRSEITALYSYGLPLLPRELAEWGRIPAQRLIVASVMSVADVGMFFLGSSMVAMLTMLTDSIEMWLNPQYMRLRTSTGADVKARLHMIRQMLLGVVTPVYIGSILFLPDIIRLVLPPGYAATLPILGPLLLASYVQIQSQFQQRQLLFLKRTVSVSVVTISTSAASLAAAYVAGGHWGVQGVAWAVALVSTVGLMAGRGVVSRYEENELTLSSSLCGLLIVFLPALVMSLRADMAFEWIWEGVKMLYLLLATTLVFLLWMRGHLAELMGGKGQKKNKGMESGE
ncbi:oligosaccharide flippase family protein [Sphingobium sp.]|uniref:lipopolysaccharide biosynthesis protein n=1 Tax=Sphingobium sp. TaxID=1912891 RepID=UPI00257D8ED8|nr:oligosaccharide flippase family protein [Sphingobium sp.]